MDNRFSPTIVMGRLVKQLSLEENSLMQCHTQSGSIPTNLNVNMDFTLLTLSATDVVTLKCHVYDSAKGRCDMILVQDLLT